MAPLRFFVSTLIRYIVLAALGSGVLGLKFNPSGPFMVDEDAPNGTVLANVTAEATQGSTASLTFRLLQNAATLITLSQPQNLGSGLWSVDLILIAKLDRDFELATRNLPINVTDGFSSDTRLFILIILDVNDNAPSFVNTPYHVTVPEDTQVGTTLRSNIRIEDPDNIGLAMQPIRLWVDEAAIEGIFALRVLSVSATRADAEIYLNKSLDFESRNSFTLSITATDAEGLNSTVGMVVTVTGVQDTPPAFLLDTYRASLLEESATGSSVIQVRAQDGDLGETNEVRYSIVQGNTTYFAIDAVTGVISTRQRLDREAPSIIDSDGVFHLVVEAEETNDTLPQLGNTTATADVFIRLEDINDHPPTFRNQTYTAFIREDAALDSIIHLDGDGYIQVFDRDQGPNANLEVTVERGGVTFSVFRPNPSQVFSMAFVLVRLNSSTALREHVGSHLDFQVVAREVSTSQRLSSSATVILAVEAAVVMTTPSPPTLIERLTASDIVVYVMGGVVFLCSILVGFIIYRLTCFKSKRKFSRRHTSSKMLKYYVNLPVPGFSNYGAGMSSAASVSSMDSSELGHVMTSDKAKDEIPSSTNTGDNREEPDITPIYTTVTRPSLVPVTLEAEGRTHM